MSIVTDIFVPKYVKTALSLLENAGYEAYLVGGCVRDALRGILPHDYDMTTSATPAEMQTVFADFRTIETGLQHGTLTVLVDGCPLEMTTYRIDGDYTDSRHPSGVTFTRDLTRDLSRRDFTVNAMAYHPIRGLADPFGGAADLVTRTMRAVGNPVTRMTEDALRILRALRFAATLDFAIEPATAAALHATAPLLSAIARERITAEFTKLLCGTAAGKYLTEFSDVLAVPLPFLEGLSAATAARLSDLPADVVTRLALLLVEQAVPDPQTALRSLRLDNQTVRAVLTLTDNADAPLIPDRIAVKRQLVRLSHESVSRLAELQAARGRISAEDAAAVQTLVAEIRAKGDCLAVSDLALNGNALAELGVPRGTRMGAILTELLAVVVEERLPNTTEALTAYVTARIAENG